jgi:hypothetical protein
MKCAHCRCAKAANRWNVQACADDRKKRSKYLCDPCDVTLNRLVLEYFGDPQAGEKLRKYKEAA